MVDQGRAAGPRRQAPGGEVGVRSAHRDQTPAPGPRNSEPGRVALQLRPRRQFPVSLGLKDGMEGPPRLYLHVGVAPVGSAPLEGDDRIG